MSLVGEENKNLAVKRLLSVGQSVLYLLQMCSMKSALLCLFWRMFVSRSCWVGGCYVALWVRRVSLLSNEALEEVTAESLRGDRGTLSHVRPRQLQTWTGRSDACTCLQQCGVPRRMDTQWWSASLGVLQGSFCWLAFVAVFNIWLLCQKKGKF